MNRLRALISPLSHHDLRVLWTSQLFSELGDWAARVALAILVERRTGSAALTGLVTTASLVPFVGSGWLLASVADRFSRRTVMIVCDVARAALFCVLILPMPIWALLAVVFLAACLTPPFEAARAALLPLAVPRATYQDAIALTQLTGELMLLVGFIGGGALAALVSPQVAVLVNAGSFILSALVLTRLRLGRAPAADAESPPGVRAGLRAVFGEPFVRRFALSYTVTGACAIVGEALAASYAAEELVGGFSEARAERATAAYAGLLTAAVPVGVIITTLLLPKGEDDTASMRIAGVVATIGSLAAMALFLLDLGMPAVLAPYAALGIVFASRIPANQVAGLRIPDHVRASAFGILAGLMLASQGVAALLGGVMADAIGVRMACVAFLAVGSVVAIYSAVAPPRQAGVDVGSDADLSSTAIPSASRGSANR